MKKAIFFLLLTGFISCSKSKPDPDPNNNGGNNGGNNGNNGNGGNNGGQQTPPGWYVDTISFKTTGTFVKFIALQKNGKIVAANPRQVARFNKDGSVDQGFKQYSLSADEIESLLVDKEDRVYVGGKFINFNGSAYSNLVRLLPDGSIDNSMTPVDLIRTGAGAGLPTVRCMALQSTGKLVIGGSFSNNVYFDLLRINQNGAVDLSFNNPENGRFFSHGRMVTSVTVLPDNKLYVTGSVVMFGDAKDLLRLTADGSFDGSFLKKETLFTSTNSQYGFPLSAAVLPDGTVLMGSTVSTTLGSLQQFNATGSIKKEWNKLLVNRICQFSENEIFTASVNPVTTMFGGINGKLSLLKQDGTDAGTLKVELGKNVYDVIRESDSTILVAGNMVLKGVLVDKGLLRIKKVK